MADLVLRFRVSRWRILAARLFVHALVVLVWIVRPVPAEADRIVAWTRRVLGRFVSRGITLAALFLSTLLTGCPAPPPVSGCAPGSTRCSPGGARPQRCSPERRWYPATDQACSAAGPEVVCCLAPNAYPTGAPLHACVPRDRCIADAPGSRAEAAATVLATAPDQRPTDAPGASPVPPLGASPVRTVEVP